MYPSIICGEEEQHQSIKTSEVLLQSHDLGKDSQLNKRGYTELIQVVVREKKRINKNLVIYAPFENEALLSVITITFKLNRALTCRNPL